jgi:CRISPR-associated exonuclease Cas4
MTPAGVLLLMAVLVVAICLAALARRLGRRLPAGTVVFSDADGRARPLVSPARGLSGKPDYLIRTRRGAHIPVELKSYRCGAHPPHPDVIQLGAYLLLLEDLHGQPPPFGMLQYADRTMRVPYSSALRAEVLKLLAAVAASGAAPPPASPAPTLCRRCPFTPICAERAL